MIYRSECQLFTSIQLKIMSQKQQIMRKKNLNGIS